MNTAKIEFTGTITELVALLEQHNITGAFTAKIRVYVGQLATEGALIRELKQCASGIAAIMLYHERTGVSLKDAKEYVKANCGNHFPGLY